MTSVSAQGAENVGRIGLLTGGRLAGLGMMLIGAGSFLAVGGMSVADPWLLASGLAWAQIGLLSIIVGLERCRFPLVHPLLLWSVTLLFGAALRPLYFRRQSQEDRTEFLAGLPDTVVTTGAMFSAIFFCFTLAGYLGARSRSHANSARSARFVATPATARRATTLAIVVSIAGAFLYLRALGLGIDDLANQFSTKRRVEVDGRFGAVGNYLWIGSVGGFAGVLVAFLRSNGTLTGRKWLWTMWMCIAAGLFCSVVAGSRNDMLLVGLYLIATLTHFGSSFRLRAAVTVLSMFVIVVVTFAGLRAAQSNDLNFVQEFASAETVEAIVGTHNWAGVEKTGIIATRVPERMDYQLGETFALAPLAPIPRTVWPAKPDVRIGPAVGEQIFDLDRNGRTGLPPGLPGELILNFGGIGVAFGGLVFGWIIGAAYSRFLATDAGSPMRVVWMVILVNLGLKMPGGDFTGVFTEIVMSSLILVVLIRTLRAPSTVPSRREAQLSYA